MGLIALTLGLTWVAVLSTLGVATAFLLAWYDLALRAFVLDWGFGLVILAGAAILGATWLRQHVVDLLMRRGDSGAVLRYARPRSLVTLTVGRDEAARNRAASAEVLRRAGRPAEALALLDAEPQPPRDRALRGLLDIIRAAALLDTGRASEARTLVAPWAEAPLTAAGRRALADLLSRLDPTPENAP